MAGAASIARRCSPKAGHRMAVAAGSIPYVSRQLESRSLSPSWPVALWRKGDSVLAALLRFNVSWVRGRSVNSPSCRRRTTFRRFGWGGLPATSLAAYAPASSCLQALSGGSIEPAACRDECLDRRNRATKGCAPPLGRSTDAAHPTCFGHQATGELRPAACGSQRAKGETRGNS